MPPLRATDRDTAIDALLAAARRRNPSGGVRVVAVDGRSGAGKTTFAQAVAAALADATGSGPPVLHLDDLYPGWDGLADAVTLLADGVLGPLGRGRAGAYRRYDWVAAAPAQEVVVPPAPWIVVEGVGAGARACAPHLSALAVLDADVATRRARGLQRDGETYRPHWERWAAQEVRHLAAENTAERADVLLWTGSGEPVCRGVDDVGTMTGMTQADDTTLDAATDALYSGQDEHLRPLHDAVVELTHDLTDDDDIAARPAPGAIHLVRDGRPFVALAPGRDRTLRIGLCLGATTPDDDRLTASDLPGCSHETALPTDALDDDVRDVEPLLAAAYDANG